MKKVILKIGVLTILAMIILPAFSVFAAENDYTVLAPLPGTVLPGPAQGGGWNTNLQTYLPGVFNLAIGLSAVFAVLMIVIGGFQYMSTDAIMKKEDGKKRITNAIWGLVLVISAWLVLWTINPNLLTLNLNIEPATVSGPVSQFGTLSTPGTPMTNEQINNSNIVRASLKLKEIDTYRDPCSDGQPTNCVNLNGLTGATTGGLISLKETCATCNLTITGGTEAGHSATGGHDTGNSVDLRLNSQLDSYIETNKTGPPVTTSLGPLYTVKVSGKDVIFLKEDDHWHATFK